MASSASELSRVVYRSRAVAPLSPGDLQCLIAAAQSRNRREAVTGVVLYDNDCFFQWLEGPAPNVARIMGSIRQDPRHADIEVLNDQSSQDRFFGEWSMKLAARCVQSGPWRQDVLEPPAEVVEDLRQRPEAAPALLVKLVPLAAAAGAAADSVKLPGKVAAVLKAVMLSSVIPEMASRHGVPPAARAPHWPVHARALDLAELLVAPDERAAIELIAELRDGWVQNGTIDPFYATLLEPAARRLGDLWSEDECSEFDVTLGLCRLQNAIRLLNGSDGRANAARLRLVGQPAVLIAPEPGELHSLGASLDSDVLARAGWAPHNAQPKTDMALQELLSETWFDVLDLSLSAAFRREHLLPRLSKTIVEARLASRNPGLLVVVAGRMFAEDGAGAMQVGADLASKTAAHVDRSIMSGLRNLQRTETPEPTPTAA